MTDTLRELLGFDNHYKLVATVSWLFGLALDVWMVLHGAPWTALCAMTSLTFVAPYGLKGLTAWLNTRGGGAVDVVSKEIEARRNGDYEPTV